MATWNVLDKLSEKLLKYSTPVGQRFLKFNNIIKIISLNWGRPLPQTAVGWKRTLNILKWSFYVKNYFSLQRVYIGVSINHFINYSYYENRISRTESAISSPIIFEPGIIPVLDDACKLTMEKYKKCNKMAEIFHKGPSGVPPLNSWWKQSSKVYTYERAIFDFAMNTFFLIWCRPCLWHVRDLGKF